MAVKAFLTEKGIHLNPAISTSSAVKTLEYLFESTLLTGVNFINDSSYIALFT